MLARLPLSALLFIALLPSAARAAGGDPLGIAGSWSVVSTFVTSTCLKPNDVGGTDAYSWLVSVDSAGQYNVAVAGATSYPRLAGKGEAGSLRLVGVEADGKVGAANNLVNSEMPFASTLAVYRLGRSDLALTLKDDVLVGTRTVLLVDGPFAGSGGSSPNYYSPCRIDYSVKATRN